jgi:hypothetical protein
MKTYLLFLCTAFCIFTGYLGASEPQKKPKVLVLIIASDGTDAYLKLQDLWRSYMHADPEHFTVYFIRGNPDLATPFEIKGDDLFVKTEESYSPGILNKTVLAIDAMLPKLNEYTHVIRTNLSSFYVFPRLLEFVARLPKEKCYCGIQMYIPPNNKYPLIKFVSGAGIIMSSDLAEMLAKEKDSIIKTNSELPDDVYIGLFFGNKSVNYLYAGRSDFITKEQWLAGKDFIPKNAFHFRAKSNYNFRTQEESFADEIFIDQELLKMFYPQKKIATN